MKATKKECEAVQGVLAIGKSTVLDMIEVVCEKDCKTTDKLLSSIDTVFQFIDENLFTFLIEEEQ